MKMCFQLLIFIVFQLLVFLKTNKENNKKLETTTPLNTHPGQRAAFENSMQTHAFQRRLLSTTIFHIHTTHGRFN
jgi:hypothetical protein